MDRQGKTPTFAVTGAAEMAAARVASGSDALLGGRYILGAIIGRGAASAVHQGRDTTLDRDVAVKVFHPAVSENDDAGRLLSEVGVLTGLDHQNLVPIFDAGTDTSERLPRTYVVMELVHGTDLHQMMQHARLGGQTELSREETAVLGAGIADALDYIHSRHIVHRDVKPANILIQHNDTPHRTSSPRLTDFGVARLVEDTQQTASGQTKGTATYFSPEQALGLSVTAATDIYSLGLVLLESLTGEAAFPGPAVASAAARIHRDPHIPDGLGPGWCRLLTAMTAREPASRPAADVVAATLRSAPTPEALDLRSEADGPPTSPTPVVTAAQLQVPEDDDVGIPPAVEPSRRVRPLALAIAVPAAMIAAGLIVAVFLILGMGADAPPVDYPAVPSELGEQLENLQEGVAP